MHEVVSGSFFFFFYKYVDHVPDRTLLARMMKFAEGQCRSSFFRSSLSFHMFENGLKQDDAQMCAKFVKPRDELLPQEECGCVLCFVDDVWKVASPVTNKENWGLSLLEV